MPKVRAVPVKRGPAGPDGKKKLPVRVNSNPNAGYITQFYAIKLGWAGQGWFLGDKKSVTVPV